MTIHKPSQMCGVLSEKTLFVNIQYGLFASDFQALQRSNTLDQTHNLFFPQPKIPFPGLFITRDVTETFLFKE